MITRADVVTEAREWIGTKWLHQASLKGVGTDCIGLIAGVARALGLPEAVRFQRDARYQGYGRSPDPFMLRDACAEFLDLTTKPLPGDILLMRFEKEPQHFGILSTPDYMIHALAQARKVVEHRIDDTWRSRIMGTFKLRGVV